ncbi:MAG: hypothetical protein BRD32_03515 [Bacteroidetes bacterium QH_2_64_74]|nr:MAG: hypothetical protein BRD32_03515 [Bacteroidetes bacterium QH_2_64_74]
MPLACPFRLIAQTVLLTLLLGAVDLGRAQPTTDTTTADTTDLSRRLEPVLDAFGDADRTTALAAEQFAHRLDDPIDVNRAPLCRRWRASRPRLYAPCAPS